MSLRFCPICRARTPVGKYGCIRCAARKAIADGQRRMRGDRATDEVSYPRHTVYAALSEMDQEIAERRRLLEAGHNPHQPKPLTVEEMIEGTDE